MRKFEDGDVTITIDIPRYLVRVEAHDIRRSDRITKLESCTCKRRGWTDHGSKPT